MRKLLRAACALAAALLAGAAHAQGYPARPVRLIVPFAAGGNADILARVLAQRLAEHLGQQVVVDNRGGANGVIGTELAAKAAPDGHTLLFVASGHAINPGLYAKLPFDPVRDFSPVAQVSTTPLVLAVSNGIGARTVKELVALARARPGALSFATQGNGSPGHLAGVLFNSANGIDIVHVPYKSTAQALTDLAAGRVQVMYPSLTAALPHVRAGKVQALAITSAQRSPRLPELPTVAESGLAGYEAGIWNGVLAPARTPEPIVARLNAAIVAIVQEGGVAERIAALGAHPAPSTPERFATFIAAEIRKWGRVIREGGVRLD